MNSIKQKQKGDHLEKQIKGEKERKRKPFKEIIIKKKNQVHDNYWLQACRSGQNMQHVTPLLCSHIQNHDLHEFGLCQRQNPIPVGRVKEVKRKLQPIYLPLTSE
jgi:hypothetical protein